MGYKLKNYLRERGITMEKFKQMDPVTQEAIRKEHQRLLRQSQQTYESEEYYLGDIVPFGPDGSVGI